MIKNLIGFFQKNKNSKKFWLLVVFNLFCYLIAFPFGLFISFVWWFVKSNKVNKKLRKIVIYSSLIFLFSTTSFIAWAYNKDPQPNLELQGIENKQVVKSPNVELKGRFEPNNFNIYINDNKIDTDNGNFKYNYSLDIGENKIIIKVSNYKSLTKEITLIRELSPEEIAQQELKQKQLEEEQRKAEELKKQEEQNNNSPESVTSAIDEQEEETNKDLTLVTRIIDGDTVELEDGNKVRLIGIDTPESGECYFYEAKNKLSNLILNKKVELKKDVSETDRYQRLLRYIYLDNVFVNDYMVIEGYAHATSYPPDVKFQDKFRQSESTARSQNKGLWSFCSTSTPKPTKKPVKTIPIAPTTSNNNSGAYVCNCSKYCSQMSSCEEAYYQLNVCGCSKRDGDSDGIPCEKICR